MRSFGCCVARAGAALIEAIARSPHRALILKAWARLLRSELPTTIGSAERGAPIAALRIATRDAHDRMVLATLARHGWNVAAAAREMECSRFTIYRVLRRQCRSDGAISSIVNE